jgi:hypothetical protein
MFFAVYDRIDVPSSSLRCRIAAMQIASKMKTPRRDYRRGALRSWP